MSDSMNDQVNGTAEVDAEQKNWAMIAHLSGLIGFLGPLIVWVIQKDKMPFVNDQAKEALNFQIAVLIAWVITGVASCFVVGVALVPVVFIGNIVFCIMAGMKANKGETYRYPFTLRLIK